MFLLKKYLRSTMLLASLVTLVVFHNIHSACSCTASSATYFNIRPIQATTLATEHQHRFAKHKKLLAKHDLVDIQTINPHIRIDLRYASKNNFTGKKIYHTKTCYLKKATALKLYSARP